MNSAGAAALAILAVTACTPVLKADPPSADRPSVTAVEIAPRTVLSGCPFQISIAFEDPHADVVTARARWTHEDGSRVHDSGLIGLPIDRAALTGRRAGTAVAALTVQHPGRYWYSVQVEDAAGRRSNVRDAWVVVHRQPASEVRSCG